MKTARLPDSHLPVPAAPTAPPCAICPHCGGVVVLRRRKGMNDGPVTYFWRHQDNRNRSCNGRNHPLQSR